MGYLNLANTAYHYQGAKQAEPILTKALKKYPHDPFFLSRKAMADYKLGDKQDARNEIQEAYTITHDQSLFNTYYLMQQNKNLDENL